MTFEQFAQSVLDRTAEPIRPITRFMRRQLIRQLIDERREAGQLPHFAPIASTGGLVDLVCELIAEWKRLEIWPRISSGPAKRRAHRPRIANCSTSTRPISSGCGSTTSTTPRGVSGRPAIG